MTSAYKFQIQQETAKIHQEIALIDGLSLATVSRVIKFKQDTGSVSPKRKRKYGRQKKTTPKDDDY